MRSMLIAALLGSVLFTGCVDPSLLPGDDDITVSGDVTVTLTLDREVEEIEYEIDGHPSPATATLEEGGPYALEAEVPGINPINLPWARPPCDLTVAHGKVEVTTYNNEIWAATFAQPETVESTVRDGGTLTVPTVDAPYNGHAYGCSVQGPPETRIFQTSDGQYVEGWLGGFYVLDHEIKRLGENGEEHFDARFNEDFTILSGTVIDGFGGHIPIHCDRL